MFARFRPTVVVAALTTLFALPACKQEAEFTPGKGMGLSDPRLRMTSQNHLKIIGIAMHAYHDSHGQFPHNISGPDGKTSGLSWRVLILPYIEHERLYKQFHLNEPWDSEHNRQFIAQIPKEFVPPSVENNYNGYTYYQSFAGQGAFLPPPPKTGGMAGSPFPGLKMSWITDGTSNTIMVAEAADPVMWTKPDDMEFNPNGPPPKLGGIFSKGANVLFADGSVRFLPNDTPADTLKAYITVNGGEVVPWP